MLCRTFRPAGVAAMLDAAAMLLKDAAAIDEAPLAPVERIDKRLAEGFLRIQQWEAASQHFQRGNPSLYTGEAIFGVISLFLTDFAPLPGARRGSGRPHACDWYAAGTSRAECAPGAAGLDRTCAARVQRGAGFLRARHRPAGGGGSHAAAGAALRSRRSPGRVCALRDLSGR